MKVDFCAALGLPVHVSSARKESVFCEDTGWSTLWIETHSRLSGE